MKTVQQIFILFLSSLLFAQTANAHMDGTAHIHTFIESVLHTLADYSPLLILFALAFLVLRKSRKED